MKQLNISLDANGFGQVVCDGAPMGKVRALRIDTKAGQPTRVVVEHVQPELGVVFRGPASLEVLPPAKEVGTDKNGRRLMCVEVVNRIGVDQMEHLQARLKSLSDQYQIDFLVLDAGSQLVDPKAVEVVPINSDLLPKPEPDLHAIVEEVFHRLQLRSQLGPFGERRPAPPQNFSVAGIDARTETKPAVDETQPAAGETSAAETAAK